MKILYRGPLSSCNYACHYCPFAKAKESRESLKRDKQALSRLGDWVRGQEQPIGILFTPWGEALIRRWYQKAIIDLSLMPHVEKVAIFSGSHAPAWEPSRDAPASRVDNDDAGASIPHSHASAWERERFSLFEFTSKTFRLTASRVIRYALFKQIGNYT